MTKQISDIIDSIVDHCRSLKTETPSKYAYIFRQSHRQEHLRSEDSRISNFDPFIQACVETEDLKRGLSIWVICRFEFELFDADLLVELLHYTDQMV